MGPPNHPAVASLQGELDIGARETIDRELVVRPGSALELDLSGIGFADIEGTRILVTQLARLSARGVSVKCTTRSPSIARLLSLVESVIAAPRH